MKFFITSLTVGLFGLGCFLSGLYSGYHFAYVDAWENAQGVHPAEVDVAIKAIRASKDNQDGSRYNP
jgi:hypothetical protein